MAISARVGADSTTLTLTRNALSNGMLAQDADVLRVVAANASERAMADSASSLRARS